MTPKDFRRIALGMQGAVEGEHMAHPDFRANGRIFATIAPDAKQGMVKLTPEQQREFMRAAPGDVRAGGGRVGAQRLHDGAAGRGRRRHGRRGDDARLAGSTGRRPPKRRNAGANGVLRRLHQHHLRRGRAGDRSSSVTERVADRSGWPSASASARTDPRRHRTTCARPLASAAASADNPTDTCARSSDPCRGRSRGRSPSCC